MHMKKPVVIFTSIAAIAAAALGVTLSLKQQSVALTPVATAPEVIKPAETADVVEAAPAAAKPPAETKNTEVAMQPAPAAAQEVPAKPAQVLPAFDTVRVEKTGDAVIAGRAAPNADVTVKWNGNIVGTAKANSDGSFVVIPSSALKTGIGAMTAEMSQNGKVIVSEGSVFVVVKKDAPATIAKVDPVAPTDVVQNGSSGDVPKDLQLTAVDYNATGDIVFSGKAAPGTVVRFYVDNLSTGEGKADDLGLWRFNGTSAIAPGTHTLRADALDPVGKVLSRIELPFLREDAATVAAAQVALAEPAQAPVTVAKTASEPVVQQVPEPKAVAEVVVATAPEATPVPVDPPIEATKKLVIQPGNSLWKLSREVYGKGRMFTVIYEANRDQLKNPNKIYPGQILTAPKQP
jgi:nucleoid-associated protein YgaU